jgi:hypothetical protein
LALWNAECQLAVGPITQWSQNRQT